MSVNFGYGGYNSINSMNAGAMGMNQMRQGGGIYQSIANQYSCPACYQTGPIPYTYKTYVNPIPKRATNPSLLSRIARKFMGG